MASSTTYAEWCRTSPEWHALRVLVLRRSPVCEACLSAPATECHHRTYRHGWLPPAWDLAAVCGPCHRSLHQSWSDWYLDERDG